MSVLELLKNPQRRRRLGTVVDRVQDVGHPHLQPLSVYLNAGVVPRTDRDDNHNQLGGDLARYQRVNPGDLVFNRLRTWQGGFGASRFEGIVSPAYIVIRPREGDARYVDYVLHSSPYLAELTRISKWMPPSQFDVLWADLRQVEIPWRPVDEQRRIAYFLDDRVSRIDRIIAARREQIDWLHQSATSDLVSTALFGSQRMPLRHLIVDERLGLWGSEAGEDEVDVQIARVADFNRSEFRLHAVPTVRSAPLSHVGPRRLRHGDVLLERSGGTQRNPVGCPAYVDSPAVNMVCSNFVSRLRPRNEVDGRYLSLVLGALYASRQQAPHSTQTTGIMNLNTGSYFQTDVPVRTHAEQAKVGAAMESNLAETRASQEQLRRSIDLLTEYKSSLITAAVTGELDVTTAGSNIPG